MTTLTGGAGFQVARTLGLFCAACVTIAFESVEASAIHSRRIHLRSGDQAEWEQFASMKPEARRLDLTFNASSNSREATLFIRQDDVRQDWTVELNGTRSGKLFTMEADLVHALKVPAGALKDGENKLSIVPPRGNDDIFIHEIVLDTMHSNPLDAMLLVSVRENEKVLPSRITITDSNGALAALAALEIRSPVSRDTPVPKEMAARPGVVYSSQRAAIGLRPGTYTVYASRGFEYSVATQIVHVAKGESQTIDLTLTREVDTRGLVSCDTHVHTFTHSGHGDCTMDERMLTLAGEGIELPIATDHNTNISYELPAERTGMRRWFTPVTGNEVTTPAGHFNIFPIARGSPVPDYKLTDWTKLNESMRATPGVRVVVLNHPRNVHSGFQPFAATNFNGASGENKRGPEFQFDAIELLNSSAQQSDYMLVYRDWFALLNYGYRITGVGSSDSHDVSRYIVGQGRTYIEAPDDDPSRIDVAAACSHLAAGRALVSMGLLARMTVNETFRAGDLATNLTGRMNVRVDVLAPSWISASRVELFANGVSIRTREISPRDGKSPGVKANVEWTIPRPAHDVHLVAIASGPGVETAYWATPKPYQPTSPGWTNRVIGVTNPIWIDADGDGRFTSARNYAKQLVKTHGADVSRLVNALDTFDEAVAAQAASLCGAAGVQLRSTANETALRRAKPQVQAGFDAFSRGQR